MTEKGNGWDGMGWDKKTFTGLSQLATVDK